MRYNLTGLSIADTNSPIETHEQLKGSGIVRNKALAIPGHLNGLEGPWASVEFVSIDRGEKNAVGEHTQVTTDEIYYIVEGRGTLTTDGVPMVVGAGCLAIAPCGTTHSIRNGSAQAPLSFLVVELQPPYGPQQNPVIFNLATQRRPGEAFAPVHVRGQLVHPPVVTLNLEKHLLGPWGALSLIELSPGARLNESRNDHYDQLLLLSGWSSVVITKCTPTEPGEVREEVRVEAKGEGYHCVVVPAGLPFQIENRASGDYPAQLLCLQVLRG